ncbi:hypothetical protein AB4212_64160, partial [Streptomyces sp. 2MCAF27]
PYGGPVNEAGYPARAVMEVLSEAYPLALTHLGAGLETRETGLLGLLDLADQLVIIWSAESLRRPTNVDAIFDWITAQGHAELLRRSIVVITGADNFNPFAELVPQGECRAMMAIPYDPHLASGQPLDLGALRPGTLARYRDLAACLAEGFSPPDGSPPG